MKEEELEKDEEKEKKEKQNEAGVLYAPEVHVDFIGVSGDLKTNESWDNQRSFSTPLLTSLALSDPILAHLILSSTSQLPTMYNMTQQLGMPKFILSGWWSLCSSHEQTVTSKCPQASRGTWLTL